ncbi:MAG: histidine kinase [Myxococcales bacterium]|nr:histidine kinase [Myxococcales bacterium]
MGRRRPRARRPARRGAHQRRLRRVRVARVRDRAAHQGPRVRRAHHGARGAHSRGGRAPGPAASDRSALHLQLLEHAPAPGHRRPSRAATFVRDFAGVTRYLLSTSDEHTVTLGEEIDLTQRYASLLSIRFGDAFRLELIDEGADRSATLPPTSLQLLVENAAKHNAFHAERPLVVELALRPGEVVVTNTRVPREDARVGGAALGLENLAERVRLCTHRPLVIEETLQRFRVTVPLGAPTGAA